MGPNGCGYAMKLAVNLGLGAYIQALSESLALGAKQGLALDQMLDVLQEAPYASSWMKSKIGVMKGEKPEMTLDIRTLRKDIMSAVATGALSGVPMPLSAGTLASLVRGGRQRLRPAAISARCRNSCAKRCCKTSNSVVPPLSNAIVFASGKSVEKSGSMDSAAASGLLRCPS